MIIEHDIDLWFVMANQMKDDHNMQELHKTSNNSYNYNNDEPNEKYAWIDSNNFLE